MRQLMIGGLLLVALLACGEAVKPDSAASVEVIEPAFGSQLERGTELFAANCAGCHGANGEGRGPFPNLNSGQHAFMHADWELITLIEGGRNGMPAFDEKLSRDEIVDIIARVKTWWGEGELSEQYQLCLLTPIPTTPTPQ